MEMIKEKELMKAKIPCEETGITVKTGICGFCGGNCMIDAYLKDGKIIKVEGSRSFPGSNGRICVKGAALKQATYHPDRLLYPMKRVGERGEGKFERISWEEALDTVAEKMKASKEAYGAKSTMIYCGHPKWFRPQLIDFANRYGTPNFGTESSTCAYAVKMANQSIFGQGIFMPQPDLRNCKLLVVWGVNPLYSSSVMMGAGFLNAVKRGVKIIVVDPKCTPTSEHADLHLRPIPGTDGALALGIAHVIIKEDLQDQKYIDTYTVGYEEYRSYVEEFTPEKVEKITGVPKEMIIEAAKLIAEYAPCPIMMSASPVVHNINGVQNTRAISMLLALTGSYGTPGGVMPPMPERAVLKGSFMGGDCSREHREDDLSHQQFPAWARLIPDEAQVARIADYMLGNGEYPIKTLLSFGMNHHMWPRPDRVEEGLQKLDFFVSTDMYMTDTCKFADIILPVQTSLEREQVEIKGLDQVYYQPSVIEPMGETWTDVDVIAKLALRLDFVLGGEEPVRCQEDFLRKALTPTGISLEELKANPTGVSAKNKMPGRTAEQILQVKTPSGKIEFVSSVLKECEEKGYKDHEGLPVYHDFREKLPMEEYPFVLSTGTRKSQLFHSRTYRLPWIAGLEDFPLVEIHPDDAKKCDLSDGEAVIVSTPVGSMELILSINSSTLPGTVNIYHGAGEKDINYLLDDAYLDPISGFPGFKSYCCRLEKKKEVSHE